MRMRIEQMKDEESTLMSTLMIKSTLDSKEDGFCCNVNVMTFMSTWETTRNIKSVSIASSSEMWILLCDIKGWPRWDLDLVSSALDDPTTIVSGSEGNLEMKKRGQFRFTLQDLDSVGGHFAYTVELTGASSLWWWNWKPSSSGGKGLIDIEMGVSLSGWAAYLYKYWIEQECVEAFDKSLLEIKRILEERSEL